MKRGQSAIEFLIIVMSVLIAFVILIGSVNFTLADKRREQINLEVREIALIVQDEVNLAVSTSDGYQREFELPGKIGNRDYDINITEGYVYVRTQDGRFAVSYFVGNVTGYVLKGDNVIRKSNGAVYLNS